MTAARLTNSAILLVASGPTVSEAKAMFTNVVNLNIGCEMNRSPEEIVKLINKELVGHSDIVKVVMLLEWYECTYSAEKYARNVSHVAIAYLMKNW